MASRYNRISELIGLFYACAEEPVHWPATLVCCLDLFAGFEVILFTPRRSAAVGGLWHFEVCAPSPCSCKRTGLARRAVEQCAGLPDEGDLLASRVVALLQDSGAQVQGASESSAAARNRKFPSCRFFNDASSRLLACQFFLRDGLHEQEVLFGMGRNASGMPFSGNDIALAALVFPHIGQAVGMYFRFEALSRDRQLADTVWAHLPGAQGVVDGEGRLLYSNQSMKLMLERAEGVFLHNGILKSKNAGGAKFMESALREMSCVHGGVLSPRMLRIPLSSGHRDQLLVLSRMQAERRSASLGIHIKVLDLATQNFVPCVIFKEIYRLTLAECRLLEALLAGLSPKDASVQFGLSANTIHSQLKSIYLKTGVHRQVDLLRLAMGLHWSCPDWTGGH